MKICNICKSSLPKSEFNRKASNNDRLDSACRSCRKKYMAKYRKDNKNNIRQSQKKYESKDSTKEKKRQYQLDNSEKIADYQKQYNINNKERLNQYHKDRYKNNPEWWYNYRKINRVSIAEYNKEYRDLHRKEITEYNKHRHNTIPEVRLRNNISNLVAYSLNYNKESKTFFDLVDFTLQELQEHLNLQFVRGMSWNNYGSEWHLDHIRPIASFSITSTECQDFKNCWTLFNLQPLWADLNIAKNDQWDGTETNGNVRLLYENDNR
jgi:hypothetical protein